MTPIETKAWEQQAACAGQQELFFANELGAPNKAKEFEAKAICRSCPVASPCLELGMATDCGVEPVGIFGGTNQYERRWLKTNPTEAAILSDTLRLLDVSPLDLASYGRTFGPSDFTSEMTTDEASVRWGVPPYVVRQWADDRGVRMAESGVGWRRIFRPLGERRLRFG